MKIVKYIREREKLFTGIGIAIFVVIATIVVLVVLLGGGDDCHRPPAVPATLSFLLHNHNLIISWPKSGFFGHCKHSFLFHYSVNGGKKIEVSTVDYSYAIPHVPGCANVVVEFWTISATDTISKGSLVEYFTVIPQDARVMNLSTIATTEGVRVTWQKPSELAECETTYRIRYSSDLGDFHDQSTDESLLIPEDIFCVTVDIEVAAVVGHSQTRYSLITFQEARILDIRTSIPNPFSPYLMAASWTYPNAELCSLKYTVAFSGEEGQETSLVETLDSRATFFFVYCVLGEITITPAAFGGTQAGPATKKIFTEHPDPHIINPVQFGEFTQTIEGVIVRWYSVSVVRNCDFAYRIAIETELDYFVDITNEVTYNISRNSFCFDLNIEILAIVGGIYGQSSTRTVRYEIEPVENLGLNLSPDGTALIATWTTNQWQEQCDLQYLVRYEHGSVTRSFVVREKSATFNRAYCATTTVRVSTGYGEAESDETVTEYEAGDPILLPQIENIQFELVEISVNISWDLAESVSECSFSYIVTAKNTALKQEANCEGITSCKITLNNFCPHTEFTITPTRMNGDPVTAVYWCDSSNAL